MPSTFLPTSQDKTEVLSPPSLMVEPEGAGVKVEGVGGGGEGERQAERWGGGWRETRKSEGDALVAEW